MLAVVPRAAVGRMIKPRSVVRGLASRLPWAWDGLCFAVPLHQTSYEGLRDVVGGEVCTLNNPSNFTPGFGWQEDDQGNPVGYFTATDYGQYPDSPVHDRPAAAITAHVRMQYVNQGDPWGGYFSNPHTDGGPLYDTWSIQDNGDGAYKPYSELSISGAEYFLSSTTAVSAAAGQYLNMFLRWQSGAAPRLDVYGTKGDLISSTVYGSTISGTFTYNPGQGIRLNAMESTSGNGFSRYSQAMVWSRYLSDTEVGLLMADPYGWYSPRRETLSVASPFPIAAVTSSGSIQGVIPVLRRMGHL